jgi:hypothetical protein
VQHIDFIDFILKTYLTFVVLIKGPLCINQGAGLKAAPTVFALIRASLAGRQSSA